MNKIILVSHGKLSEGMYDSIQMIIGDVNNVTYYGLMPGQDNNEIYKSVNDYINENGNDNTYVVVCDLLNGSVSNAVSRLSEKENVYVINGMNMGLVIGLALEFNDLNKDNINRLIAESKEGINLVQLNNLANEEELI